MSDRRILVVDDEPDMVENCTRILRRAGYRVLATTDPEDSWKQHAADTLREGYWLNDPRAVEILATEGPRAIEELRGQPADQRVAETLVALRLARVLGTD